MKILATEFSSERRSVAVVAAGQVRARAEETGGRTARAFGLIEQALGEAKLDRAAIECLAVGLGPGSYTGIRLAISIAQGWQVARSVRLLGVSSVECLAAQARAEKLFGRVHILIDAQRHEFYLATYEIQPSDCRIVEPLRLATFDEVNAIAGRGEVLVSPDCLAGFPGSRIFWPAAAVLGQLASARSDFVTGDTLQPIYLREASFVKAPAPRALPAS